MLLSGYCGWTLGNSSREPSPQRPPIKEFGCRTASVLPDGPGASCSAARAGRSCIRLVHLWASGPTMNGGARREAMPPPVAHAWAARTRRLFFDTITAYRAHRQANTEPRPCTPGDGGGITHVSQVRPMVVPASRPFSACVRWYRARGVSRERPQPGDGQGAPPVPR